MSINITSEKIEKVKEVIKLAYKRKVTYVSSEDGNIFGVPQTKEHIQAENELTEFLKNLTYEEVKFIHTVMYMGRDTFNYELEKYSGLELLEMTYRSLQWTDQEVEINHMVGKMPLDEYLQRGLEILLK